MDKQLDELQELEQKLSKKRTDVTAFLSQVKAEHGDDELEMERGGDTVTVTESDLWEERNDKFAPQENREQADELLKERHPDLFKQMKERDELAQKLSDKFEEIWGFPFSKITPGRITKMIRESVEYYMEKMEK